MRVVTPFRPFAPESQEHIALGPFDWTGAIGMLRDTVRRSCRCDTVVITDVDTDLEGAAFHYVTERRRLMLWILEVCLRYLESDDFDCDTAMVSPDILVLRDLQPFFCADLGVIVRSATKFVAADRPLLNSVQWWRVEAKPRLVAFYRQALALADDLPEDVIRWGADTVPLVSLLTPIEPGRYDRAGLSVAAFEQREAMATFSTTMLRKLREGRPYDEAPPLLDFKYLRKHAMREFFDLAVGTVAP
jgi:hypothetical protein